MESFLRHISSAQKKLIWIRELPLSLLFINFIGLSMLSFNWNIFQITTNLLRIEWESTKELELRMSDRQKRSYPFFLITIDAPNWAKKIYLVI